MRNVAKLALSLISSLALALAIMCLTPADAFAAGQATFDTGSNVRSAWTALAGSRDNVTSIRQYSGDAVPEGVETRVVSSSSSETPIYSWFEDGIIYYWSEDTHPYANADASYWFYSFTNATFIDAKPIDTSKVTDMEGMFAQCVSLETLDVSGFDTSNVRCMYIMFYGCSSLKELDVSHFNTSNATSLSDGNYGSLCGMFISCSSLTTLDLSSFDMTNTSWPYHTQNMFPGCTSLSKLILGPNNRFNSYTALSGNWTQEDSGLVLSGSALTSNYNAGNALAYSGVWIRDMPEGHFYRTDGSLGEHNLWEVHTPDDRFKGYCLNLNRFGVGEELDRVLAESDDDIVALLCGEDEGSVHGFAPLGSNMREALITLIYYGWPNDEAGIQERYGLTDQEYLEVTQQAIWDFTDRYDDPAGPSHYEGNLLAAYNELVSQRFANIEGEYILFLYKSWDRSKQNLLSIMGVDDQEYGGVEVRKKNADGSEDLAGAVFTVYDEEGNEVGTMTTSASGSAFICRTDHTAGLPLGKYTVRETTPPAGYFLSDVEYHFEVTHANEIVTVGWRVSGEDTIEEEMIYYDAHDDEYEGGGIAVIKQSKTGKMLVGAEFTIYDSEGNEVATLVTNDSGIASTGRQDLPLGTYTVRETKAPAGHTIGTGEQTVTLTENNQLLTLTFYDEEKRGSIKLQATKVFVSENRGLEEGMFTFELQDARGNVLQTATNDAEGNVTFKPIEYTPDDLGYANYRIVEMIGDDPEVGYDRHQENVTVTIYDDGGDTLRCEAVYDSDGAVFTNTDDATRYETSVLKQKLNTDVVIDGAVLEVRDASNRLIDSWVSGEEAHTLVLDPGTYTLRELTAPTGYFEVSDIKFTVAADGTLSSGSSSVSIDGSSMDVYDTSIPSTEMTIRKVDAETGDVLEGAEFSLVGTVESTYSSTKETGSDGTALFAGLETGTYTLTETSAPEGYTAKGGPWNVEVVYNRAISKTGNINTTGSAAGNYSTEVITDTIKIPGSPDHIHIELKYQTEDGYDYLELLDASDNVITQDRDGNPIGDTRDRYRGRIWGGMESGTISTMSFDLDGDTVKFHFVPDEGTAAYGYHAIVTSESRISVTDESGNAVSPEDGVYVFENERASETSVQFSGTKTLEGRSLAEGEFSFTLTGSDGTDETVTNDADGHFSFPEITFTEEGTYKYEVREVPGSAEGVTYDDTAYAITVTVAKEGGELVATISGGTETGDDLAFTNTYEEGPSEDEDDKKPEEDEEESSGGGARVRPKRGSVVPNTGDGNPSAAAFAGIGLALVASSIALGRRREER